MLTSSLRVAHLQQLALAQPRVNAHEDVDVAADGHRVQSTHILAHSAQQRQHQPSLQGTKHTLIAVLQF